MRSSAVSLMCEYLPKNLIIRFFTGAFALLISSSLYSEEHFGIYTNMTASDGHFSGFEVFFVPNSKVIFQEAEGWPKDPIILDIKSDESSDYVAAHPGWGKLRFKFEENRVTIDFVDSNYSQVLNKGKSFWQK